jgi:hypothetical protein
MKTKSILFVLAVLLVTAGPLASYEGPSEALVLTAIEPAAAVIPVSLPEAGPVELLFEEPVPAPAPRLSIPRALPVFKPSPISEKALFDANLVFMVGINIADYISTREALKYPGLTETNPLMKPFVKNPAAFAAIKLGTTALSYLSMKAIFKKNKTVAWIMTTASNVLLSYVVVNNMRLVQGARSR